MYRIRSEEGKPKYGLELSVFGLPHILVCGGGFGIAALAG